MAAGMALLPGAPPRRIHPRRGRRADSEEMETLGVAQPPCVYAEGPSISSHVIKKPEVFPYAKTSCWEWVGARPRVLMSSTGGVDGADVQHPPGEC